MAKPRRKTVRALRDGTDAEVIEFFRQWREEQGLPFNVAFLPHAFDDLADLEWAYLRIEDAAKEARKVAPPPPPAASQEEVTKAYVNQRLDANLQLVGRWCAQQIGALQKRVKELETVALKERGVWRANGSYVEGDVVTDSGSLWVCKKLPHGSRPGASAAWRLLFKTAPRREKDAKP